jgi:hypothetical protein
MRAWDTAVNTEYAIAYAGGWATSPLATTPLSPSGADVPRLRPRATAQRVTGRVGTLPSRSGIELVQGFFDGVVQADLVEKA